MLLFDKFSPFTSVVTFDFRFQPLHIKIYQVIINGSMNTWLILAQEPYVKFSFVDSLIFFFFLILMTKYLLVPKYLAQLRRERIAERIRALQELVPSVNKVCPFLSDVLFFLWLDEFNWSMFWASIL